MLNAQQKFKATPVGDIPVDWECVKLKKIAKISSGATPSRSNPDYWNGSVPWIKTGAINFCEINTAEEWITEKAVSETAAKWVPADTILMAMYGQGKTRGQVAILKIPATTNQACAAITTNNLAELKFAYFYLAARYKRIRSLSNTGNQENLSSSLIQGINVALPPLAEQRKIADILGTWDRAIDTQQKLITALTQRKKSLAQKLLTGKTRLPGFEEPWKTTALAEIFERIKKTAGESTPRVLSITAGRGFVDQREKFSRVIAGKNIEKYIQLRRGDFSYNKGNSKRYQQGCVYQLKEYDDGVVPNVFYSFRNKGAVDSDFYKHYFEVGNLNHQLSRVINSGVRNDGLLNLHAKDFFKSKVHLPPKPEQTAIAKVLTTADRELALHTQHLTTLQTQKRALMQQLLTGKVRVAN